MIKLLINDKVSVLSILAFSKNFSLIVATLPVMNLQQSGRRQGDMDDFTRGRIYSLHFDAQWSYTRVSQRLGISRATVASYCLRLSTDDSKKKSQRTNCHRPRKTSIEEDNQILQLARCEPFKTAVDITREIGDEIDVSVSTVRRRLSAGGLKCYCPAIKPFLTELHKKRRMTWSEEHLEWGIDEWRKVCFADEANVTLEPHVQYVRRPRNTRYNSKYVAVKQNRSVAHVSVWGAFSAHDFTPLVHLTERLNSERYVTILDNNLLPRLCSILPDGGLLLHDNAPIHVSTYTTQWLTANNIRTMQHPAISPDLNCIENVWGRIKLSLQRKKIKNSAHLFQECTELWRSFMSDVSYRNSLIKSMPSRVLQVNNSRGNHTSY